MRTSGPGLQNHEQRTTADPNSSYKLPAEEEPHLPARPASKSFFHRSKCLSLTANRAFSPFFTSGQYAKNIGNRLKEVDVVVNMVNLFVWACSSRGGFTYGRV